MRSSASLALLLLGSLAVLLTATRAAQAESDAPLYELRVGSRRVAVTPGEAFEIELPRDVRLAAVLRPTPRTYSQHGMRFEHPSDMEIETTLSPPLVVVRAARGRDLIVGLMLGPPDPSTQAETLASAVRKVRSDFEGVLQTPMTETSVSTEIAGKTQPGVRLAAEDLDDPIQVDVYVVPLDGHALWMTFRHLRSRQEEAEREFRMIAQSFAQTTDDEVPAEPGSAFRLHVGERSYDVDVDRTFRIEGPDGKQHRVVLVPGRKTYADHGIRFSYPGDATIETEMHAGAFVRVTVEHGKDYSAGFNVFGAIDVPLEKIRALTLESVRSSVERETGLEFGPPRACKRKFLGVTCEGRRITASKAGDRARIETYALKVGKRTVSALYYWRVSKEKIAERAFEQIASTLRASD